MMCRDGDGPLYVKFGRSMRIMQRLTEIKTSCPIPAKWFMTIRAGRQKMAVRLEKALHEHFSSRHSTGEWFKFDVHSAEDKKDFNEGIAWAAKYVLGSAHPYKWDKLSVPALNRYNQGKKQRFLNCKNRNVIAARAKKDRKRRSAWKELSEYGSATT